MCWNSIWKSTRSRTTLQYRKHSLHSTLQVRMRKPDRIDSEKIRHKNSKINDMKRRVRRTHHCDGLYSSILWHFHFQPFFSFSRLLAHNNAFSVRWSLCNNIELSLSMEYPQATPLFMWIVDSVLCYINVARHAMPQNKRWKQRKEKSFFSFKLK